MSSDEVFGYFDGKKAVLEQMGFEVLQPMTAKGYLRNEIAYKAYGYDNPVSTNHAILRRDHWMVSQCDILLANLNLGTQRVSIGTVAELAWAYHMNKHTVVVMGGPNIHKHAFILDMADVIFPNMQEAQKYLSKVARQEA